MPTFLTVKEAARLTGKSPSSIRRVIYPIIHDDQHPDREHVQPNVEEARALRLNGESFAWRLSEELLQREVPITAPGTPPQGDSSPRSAVTDNSALLLMLQKELEIKNQQIGQQAETLAQQLEVISGLSERLREGNVLIGSLQQRLALTEGPARTKAAVAETVTTKSGVGESVTKPKANAKSTKSKPGFFARFFR